MGTHSRILAWGIPLTEEPGGATVHGVTESDMTEWLTMGKICCLKLQVWEHTPHYPRSQSLDCSHPSNSWMVGDTEVNRYKEAGLRSGSLRVWTDCPWIQLTLSHDLSLSLVWSHEPTHSPFMPKLFWDGFLLPTTNKPLCSSSLSWFFGLLTAHISEVNLKIRAQTITCLSQKSLSVPLSWD